MKKYLENIFYDRDNKKKLIYKNGNLKNEFKEIKIIDNIPRFNNNFKKKISYNVLKKKEIKNFSKWRKYNFNFLKKNLDKLSSEKKILDLGAGQDSFIDLYHNKDAYFCDFEPYNSVDFTIDIEKEIPIVEKSFDVIVLSNVLEHSYKANFLIKECKRLIKNDGKILITVPFNIMLHQEPYDYFRYTEYALKRIFIENSINDYKIFSVGNHADLLLSALKIFKKQNNLKNKIIQKITNYQVALLLLFLKNFVKPNYSHKYILGYHAVINIKK